MAHSSSSLGPVRGLIIELRTFVVRCLLEYQRENMYIHIMRDRVFFTLHSTSTPFEITIGYQLSFDYLIFSSSCIRYTGKQTPNPAACVSGGMTSTSYHVCNTAGVSFSVRCWSSSTSIVLSPSPKIGLRIQSYVIHVTFATAILPMATHQGNLPVPLCANILPMIISPIHTGKKTKHIMILPSICRSVVIWYGVREARNS